MCKMIKKLILTFTTILFLSSCATTMSLNDILENSPADLEAKRLVYIGQSKQEFCWARTSAWYAIMCYKYDAVGKGPNIYYERGKYEILASKFNRFYVFKDVSVKYTNANSTGNGNLEKIFYSMSEAKKFVDDKFPKPPAQVASKPKTSSKTKTSKSGGSSGSAFFVTQRGHIITNYHVVKGCKSNPIIKYKNKDIDTKIIAKDQLLDLALLKADLTNTKYVTLSNKQPKKLQRIIASGYPFGKYISDDLKFTSGIVSSLKGPNDDSTLVQVDAALNPGNSGGPIVDEESGRLVAVAVMGMKKNISEAQNFGIKTSSVKNFLDANQIKTPSSFGAFRSIDVAKLLEESTLYTFCR